MKKSIYDLELHEVVNITSNAGGSVDCMKVADGWLYTIFSKDTGVCSTFVPKSNV